jgi:hypothetical protein
MRWRPRASAFRGPSPATDGARDSLACIVFAQEIAMTIVRPALLAAAIVFAAG